MSLSLPASDEPDKLTAFPVPTDGVAKAATAMIVTSSEPTIVFNVKLFVNNTASVLAS